MEIKKFVHKKIEYTFLEDNFRKLICTGDSFLVIELIELLIDTKIENFTFDNLFTENNFLVKFYNPHLKKQEEIFLNLILRFILAKIMKHEINIKIQYYDVDENFILQSFVKFLELNQLINENELVVKWNEEKKILYKGQIIYNNYNNFE